MVQNPLAQYAIVCHPPLNPAQHYSIHPDHRNHSDEKSQWTVTAECEFNIFTIGATYLGGYEPPELYGLNLEGGRPAKLGESEDGDDVLIAKFTRDQVEWHGYPYIHTRPKRDVPRYVLEKWRLEGMLSKPMYNRLLRKQPC